MYNPAAGQKDIIRTLLRGVGARELHKPQSQQQQQRVGPKGVSR